MSNFIAEKIRAQYQEWLDLYCNEEKQLLKSTEAHQAKTAELKVLEAEISQSTANMTELEAMIKSQRLSSPYLSQFAEFVPYMSATSTPEPRLDEKVDEVTENFFTAQVGTSQPKASRPKRGLYKKTRERIAERENNSILNQIQSDTGEDKTEPQEPVKVPLQVESVFAYRRQHPTGTGLDLPVEPSLIESIDYTGTRRDGYYRREHLHSHMEGKCEADEAIIKLEDARPAPKRLIGKQRLYKAFKYWRLREPQFSANLEGNQDTNSGITPLLKDGKKVHMVMGTRSQTTYIYLCDTCGREIPTGLPYIRLSDTRLLSKKIENGTANYFREYVILCHRCSPLPIELIIWADMLPNYEGKDEVNK